MDIGVRDQKNSGLGLIKDPVQRLKKLNELSMMIAGDPVNVFRHVARLIGEIFDVRVVCLSEIRGDELYFISVYVDGEVMMDAGHCPLDITPCATVENTKDVRIYDEVIEKFPEASFLKTHNAFSYCGFPAIDSGGEVIAVTCLLDDKPHEFSDEDQDLLRTFGQRISMEIERQRLINVSKQAEEEIQRLAYYDSLTQLPNRALFMDRMQQSLNLSIRHNYSGALLYMDLDRFKNINDSLGHSVGDTLLQELAVRLGKCVRNEDTVARIGGDEFVVLLTDIGSDKKQAAKEARLIADKILANLSEPYFVENHELQVAPSIGIALYPEGDNTIEDVIKYADTAMYRAKVAGREAIQFFQPNMQTAAHERLALEKGLRHAIEQDEMLLHYQPLVELSDNQVIGAEVLLRWQHPEEGLISPARFIPVAEETGQILPIGDWVLRNTISQVDAWNESGFKLYEKFLTVNVSPRQFRQVDFVQQVMQVFEETEFQPTSLKLEITEGVVMADVEDTIKKMCALKSHGISFAIDDFGTGYSSLAYLKRLPLDVLKIDKSFVQDIADDPDDAVIVDTIIAMAKHLGLEVVAEGVETEAELKFLREHGCGCYQGYYFSKPVPADEFVKFLD